VIYSRILSACLIGLAVAGCAERTTPAAPELEQAVLNLFGGLAVGEVVTVTGPGAETLFVGPGATAGEYVIIPFHSSAAGRARLSVEITGHNLGSFVATTEAPAGSGTALPGGPPRPDEAMHEALHSAMTEAVTPVISRFRERIRMEGVPAVRSSMHAGRVPEVGETLPINANTVGVDPVTGEPSDEAGLAFACINEDLRTARVEAVTQRAIVLGDVDNPAGGFTRQDYEALGRRFDELIDPVVRQHFDNPADVDGTGRVMIFFTRAVNELTTPDFDGFVGGFFWARDLFPRSECPASNEAEIFFMLAPDPNAQASHIRHTRENVFRSAPGTLGHEYQHLINAGRRLHVNDAQTFEETWLDEGLSHAAEEVLFYQAAGLQPRSNIDRHDVSASEQRWDAFVDFQSSNLARYGLYIQNVSDEGVMNVDGLTTRGAAWSFVRYVTDHSGRPDAEFLRALVNSRTSGVSNLARVLDDPVLDWVRRWATSLFTDDLVALVGHPDPLLRQPSWNLRDVLPLFNAWDDYPLEIHRLAPGGRVEMSLLGGGAGFVRVRGTTEGTGQVVITSGGVSPPQQLRVTVIRTR
jgi:hypothetical protein